jgi:hypothetical protein
MQAHPAPEDPERLGQEIQESIETVRKLVDEMKIVQEHEDAVLKQHEQEREPPLFKKEHA